MQANNKKFLSFQNAPASVIRFKQKVCDKVRALAVCALFILKPELVCNADNENA